jgi:hypothetical protein
MKTAKEMLEEIDLNGEFGTHFGNHIQWADGTLTRMGK